MLKIGIIGYGGRISGMTSYFNNLNVEHEITAITDIDFENAKTKLKEQKRDPEKTQLYDSVEKMLNSHSLDGVMIGTRCSLHAKYGAMILNAGIPMFIEKPIATNMADLKMLKEAADNAKAETVVSFPLRVTPIVKKVKQIIDSGELGTIEHVQAWNNVPYGTVYYMYWYRDENETQGLFLQKATHDFDYINHLLGLEPKYVCAMKSKQVYKGNRPAGLTCNECKEWEDCMESPYNLFLSKQDNHRIELNDYKCGFAVDTGNEDSGSAIVEYETGMHVSYSQNFFARKSAGARGARLFGYNGTVEFDWFTDEIKIMWHHKPMTDTIKLQTGSLSHGGGDVILIDSFVKIMKGEGHSIAPINTGIQSVLMCLKAKESALTREFKKISFDE